MTPDKLRAKLAKADADALAKFLANLAEERPALRKRIEALASREQPSAYASSLERRLQRLGGQGSFISYRESDGFARELGGWLDDVEKDVLGVDPRAAGKLVEHFIRADAQIMEGADDSDGFIGATFRRACSLWHRAAAALPADDDDRVQRVYDLHAGNDYGTRDAILDEAATSLSETELRRLAGIYEAEARAKPKREDRWEPSDTAATALGQVARALRDAALYERSVRIRSPKPNEVQAEHIAAQYLEFGPVERAVEWLTRGGDRADRRAPERLELLAEAYEKQGDAVKLREVRRRLAEGSLSAELFNAYAALLAPKDRNAARKEALDRAGRSDRPVDAAQFLVALGETERAAAVVLGQPARLVSAFYGALLPLAQDFAKQDHPLAAVACYRALTDQILDHRRAAAYRHAKRYIDTLAALHKAVESYGDLGTHVQYVADLRTRHGRKYSFWKLFGENEASQRTRPSRQ